MFTQLCTKLKELQTKYKDTFLIMGGDYNEAPDDNLDRIPPRPGMGKLRPGGRMRPVKVFNLARATRILSLVVLFSMQFSHLP